MHNEQFSFGSYEPGPPKYKGIRNYAVYIEMRDGVRLAADVNLPGNLPEEARIPTLLVQSRYWREYELKAPFKWFMSTDIMNKYFKDFNPYFTSHGYAVMEVDVRGTGASFGGWRFPFSPESVEDGRDIVDWIVSQPWSDGSVGAFGISYLGNTAELLVALDHPAVKAVIPQFNHPDPYSDIAFPGGLYNRRFIKSWGYFDKLLDRHVIPLEFGFLGKLLLQGVKPVDGDRGRRYLKAAAEAHADNADSHQLAKSIQYRDHVHSEIGASLDEMSVHHYQTRVERSPTITCGWASWMDAGTADAALRRWLTYENAKLAVIGAWEHGGRFDASPFRPVDGPANPPLPGQWEEMHRFYDVYIKGKNPGDEKRLIYYTMEEERWKVTDIWPPEGTQMQRWYCDEGNRLSPDKPSVEEGADRYKVDFTVQSSDCNRWWEMAVLEEKAVSYPDRATVDEKLLTYTSPPLDEDLEITGYPVANLFVRSTETDGAFYVYLEAVNPDGRVFYLTEGLLRAIHRSVSSDPSPYRLQVPHHSYREADAQPLVPGEVAELSFGLQPTSVLVRRRWRLRIAIAGHDEGAFVRIPTEGSPVITVERNQVRASCIDLPVVRRHG